MFSALDLIPCNISKTQRCFAVTRQIYYPHGKELKAYGTHLNSLTLSCTTLLMVAIVEAALGLASQGRPETL